MQFISATFCSCPEDVSGSGDWPTGDQVWVKSQGAPIKRQCLWEKFYEKNESSFQFN